MLAATVASRARPLSERPTLAAGLLLGLFVLLYLWPVLLAGKVLSPTSALYAFTPWAAFRPGDVFDYYNPIISDVAQTHYPWNAFARQLLHEGVFPAWNPHVFAGGVPFFANPQTVLLSPFSLPIWVLPMNYGLGVSAALKLWTAAFGTYLLARELRLSFLPALLGGVVYALCAFHVMWLTHESLVGVSALLPWMLWLIERLLRDRSLGAGIGLAVATAVAVTGGHPGTQLHVLAAAALYAALRAGTLPGIATAERLRRLAFAGAAIALGVLLVAVMFVPELLSSRDTLGTAARKGGNATQPGANLPFEALRTVLFPDWWGRPTGIEVQPTLADASGAGSFNERTFYAGIVALLLAGVAVATAGGWRRKAPFVVLGALALAIPVHVPGVYWLATHLPGFEVVQNQRMHFVFALAVAVLAAFGLQTVLERPRDDLRRFAFPAAGLAGAFMTFVAIGPSGKAIGDTITHFVSGTDFADPKVIELTSVAWLVLLASGLGAALLAAWRWPWHATAIVAAIVALTAFDMLRFAYRYQPMGSPERAIPPVTPAAAFLARHADEGRVFGVEYALLQDWAMQFGIDDVRGYDPPFPTLRYYRLWRTAAPEQMDWAPFTIETLSGDALRLVSVLGARFVIVEAKVDKAPGGAIGAYKALRPVYTGRDATIFVNENAAPRVLVPQSVTLSAGEDETRALLIGKGVDPRATVVVERGEPGAASAREGAAGAGSGDGRERGELAGDVARRARSPRAGRSQRHARRGLVGRGRRACG